MVSMQTMMTTTIKSGGDDDDDGDHGGDDDDDIDGDSRYAIPDFRRASLYSAIVW